MSQTPIVVEPEGVGEYSWRIRVGTMGEILEEELAMKDTAVSSGQRKAELDSRPGVVVFQAKDGSYDRFIPNAGYWAFEGWSE